MPCGTCEKTYIGQTNRKISVRIDEHRVSLKRRDTSAALAFHALTEGHCIDFEKARTLKRLDQPRARTYREAIEIVKRPHCMNTRDDALRLPGTWKPLLADCEVRAIMPSEPLTEQQPRVDRRRKTPLAETTPAPSQPRSTRLAAAAVRGRPSLPPVQRDTHRAEASRSLHLQSSTQTADRAQQQVQARAVIGQTQIQTTSRCTRSQTRAAQHAKQQ